MGFVSFFNLHNVTPPRGCYVMLPSAAANGLHLFCGTALPLTTNSSGLQRPPYPRIALPLTGANQWLPPCPATGPGAGERRRGLDRVRRAPLEGPGPRARHCAAY
jgi:hypothetical protein